MKKLLLHKIGTQRIYSTEGIDFRLGNLPTETEEVEVDDNLVNEVFAKPKKFKIVKHKLEKI